MPRVFESPAAYVQGRRVTEEIGAPVAPLESEYLLLADEVVLDLVGERVVQSLEVEGIGASTIEFEGEASETEIDRVADVVDERDVDIVVGAGAARSSTRQRPSARRPGARWSRCPPSPPSIRRRAPSRSSTARPGSSRSTGSTTSTPIS